MFAKTTFSFKETIIYSMYFLLLVLGVVLIIWFSLDLALSRSLGSLAILGLCCGLLSFGSSIVSLIVSRKRSIPLTGKSMFVILLVALIVLFSFFLALSIKEFADFF